MIKRIFSTKKDGYNVAEKRLQTEIKNVLGIELEDLKIFERYDIDGLEDEFFKELSSIIAEKPLDNIYFDDLPTLEDYQSMVIEFLPGQYDQRADVTMQAIELLTEKKAPIVKCAKVYIIKGASTKQFNKIKKYLINPIESRLAEMSKPMTLKQEDCQDSHEVEVVQDFINFDDEQVEHLFNSQTFAMTLEDLIYVRDYFVKEKRNPTIAELKVIDTYWSDHCRHTTFLTELTDIEIDSNNVHIKNAYEKYCQLFEQMYGEDTEKYKCLMDIATIAAKKLRKSGELDNLDISDEINACSVEVDVDNDGKDEKWLIMFKNETHNHPTEMEPYGGAATCLGGAIRDPLSGRAYVYQGMRITGAANPNEKIEDTLKGKLPQRVITTTAAKGFSSYSNQVGAAVGLAHEIYHDNYKAKRLEAGYVIGGVLKENVVRNNPKTGDLILLVGGETGRDGCGGATGSSKAHTEDSLSECGAEVQKGNPSIGRKLQRLFANKEVSRLIIKCNDFGAGGVSVAVGELADSLDIYLDRVPTKYDGLSGTELAISESQERMAVVINKNNLDKFVELCNQENISAVNIAEVTSTNRMRMFYRDKTIVDLKRSFLNSNGVKQTARAVITEKNCDVTSTSRKKLIELARNDIKQAILKDMSKLRNCSQKGLIEMFDHTVGASSIILPLGGRNQLTPSIVMAAKPPVSGQTNTATVSSFGCPIDLLEISPFKGAIYSIVLSINKLIASGVPLSTIRLSLQEFFKRLGKDEQRWGEVTSALLGALYAQLNLGIAAIGGKDSMSGSFGELDVPPTLISFAMGIGKADTLIDNVFKKGQKLFIIKLERDENFVPDFKYLSKVYNILNINIEKGNILAATVVETDAMVALLKSLLGDKLGISFARPVDDTFSFGYGDFIVAVKDISQLHIEEAEYLGIVNETGIIRGSDFEISIEDIYNAYDSTLKDVFPVMVNDNNLGTAKAYNFEVKQTYKCKAKVAKPTVFIPTFPGTNGEFDMAKRFEIAGAKSKIAVFKNQCVQDIEDTIESFAKAIRQSQIIAFPGGYSFGNEPNGSGKVVAALFRKELIAHAIKELLNERDGLILGLGNGFQSLIKLGLLPYGKIGIQSEYSPTLTLNSLNRHISTISKIRVSSNLSPWMNKVKVGEIYNTPISTSEGRFVANSAELLKLVENGQIATQYVDFDGNVSMLAPFNPTSSQLSIEAITSLDGRILGKVGHSDRIDKHLYKNVEGNYDMKLFESGVEYFM